MANKPHGFSDTVLCVDITGNNEIRIAQVGTSVLSNILALRKDVGCEAEEEKAVRLTGLFEQLEKDILRIYEIVST